MIPVDEARARILAGLAPLGTESVALADAAGRVLAAPVVARLTQPPFDASAMDGYAVRAADAAQIPVTLRVIGQSAAGHGFAGRLNAGEAVRIFTGAPVPAGADAVVIQEDTTRQADQVTIREAARPGRHIRRAGLDFTAGSIGIQAPRRLTARDIGLAAAMNQPWLTLRRRPRIALLATGDELVRPGEPLGPDQIVCSNALSLAALIRAAGAEAIDLGIAPDDRSALGRMVEGARGADLLVTIGGASVGDHDLIRDVLGEQGLELDFWQVAMRPGKPLMFGKLGATPMLGLPGNPVSALVCGLVFLRPAIDRLLGLPEGAQAMAQARLGSDLAANDRRQDYLRATLSRSADGALVATPFATQDSSMISRLASAEALIVRAPHAAAAKAGEAVDILALAADPVGF
ncbi:MAG: molybdopterin molybdotransferase MoeA [Alphaproteobacteria bacterium]|nr:molybdopterin molybdotransferase MoeA [Alphaproteobacteria bacterium]